MKAIKRLLLGALSLVVLAGAVFTFTGCSEVSGKTYAYEGLTYTIITGVDETDPENKKITETKTLTAREYWLYTEKEVKLEDLAARTLTEAEEKEFDVWNKAAIAQEIVKAHVDFTEIELEFKSNKVSFIISDIEEDGEGDKTVYEGTYAEKDGVIDCEILWSMNVQPSKSYALTRYYVNNEKVEKRVAVIEAEDYAKDALYMVNVVYAVV